MSAAVGQYDVACVRGEPAIFPVQRKLDGVVTNITGRTYRCQVRLDQAATGTAEATFTCVITDAVNGVLSMSLTASQTLALKVGGRYFFGLEETVPGFEAVTVWKGQLSVEPKVTK